MREFLRTLLWHDLLPLALAVYFGTVMQGFLDSLVNHILVPLFEYVTTFYFGRATPRPIDTEQFFIKTLTMIIACVILYFFIKLFVKYVEKT